MVAKTETKILITGARGMLGSALCEELSEQYEVIGFGREDCDITEKDQLIAKVSQVQPEIIIHTAAYTDVDGCEHNPDKAHRINALGTETVSLACQRCGAFGVFISTDFVFDGEKKSAYIEEDPPNPINIYGKSKLEGERYVQSSLKDFIIVRSSWLFGKGGRNFVNTILEKAQRESRLKVVNDQFGSPTYTEDLAQSIGRLISMKDNARGIYHITNSGSCSWCEFALAIKEFAKLNTDIVPISSEQYRSPTRRPKMSILDNRYYQEVAGKKPRHWKEALREYLSG